jgi:hypothetical protein
VLFVSHGACNYLLVLITLASWHGNDIRKCDFAVLNVLLCTLCMTPRPGLPDSHPIGMVSQSAVGLLDDAAEPPALCCGAGTPVGLGLLSSPISNTVDLAGNGTLASGGSGRGVVAIRQPRHVNCQHPQPFCRQPGNPVATSQHDFA